MITGKAPNACKTMAELRQEIDAIDLALMDLLVLRSTYIDRAVDLKQIEKLPARTVDRVEQVVGNARRSADAHGFDADLAEKIWRELIEWSIDRENKELGR